MAVHTQQPVIIDGRTLLLSNPTKVLWPDRGYTKADLIRYYVEMAPYLLPHLAGRPITITRHPDGIDGESFYQKDCPAGAPAWVRTHRVMGKEKPIDYVLVDSPATLAWLANLAAIELHPWLSRIERADCPDIAVVDLDPAEGATFDMVVEVARLVHTLLDELGLIGLPKLSGASGLHIYIPIAPRYPYRTVSRLIGSLGALIARAAPELATTERRVKERAGRVYIDHLQNLPGKTIVAPYSLRPLPSAPASIPITWEELGMWRPDAFDLASAPHRARAVGDLFAPVLTLRQALDPALERLRCLDR